MPKRVTPRTPVALISPIIQLLIYKHFSISPDPGLSKVLLVCELIIKHTGPSIRAMPKVLPGPISGGQIARARIANSRRLDLPGLPFIWPGVASAFHAWRRWPCPDAICDSCAQAVFGRWFFPIPARKKADRIQSHPPRGLDL